MYLVIMTIIYSAITQIFNLNYALAFGIYLVGLSVGKGVLSKEVIDIFNLRKMSYMYKKIGFKDTLMELISLVLIYINTYLIDYEPFSTLEFIITFVIFLLVYRFLFWGIILKFKEFSFENSTKRE
ncbi:hypothetical protein [Carnobacterium pleistocenium]|uniref:hypothetical protein n=1 Tax=Carnobacterium pleistocenium TaxID=181073 RepID=UPI00055577B9|nr:hypothetical protein [Carnobacterium pleistocenium]